MPCLALISILTSTSTHASYFEVYDASKHRLNDNGRIFYMQDSYSSRYNFGGDGEKAPEKKEKKKCTTVINEHTQCLSTANSYLTNHSYIMTALTVASTLAISPAGGTLVGSVGAIMTNDDYQKRVTACNAAEKLGNLDCV